MSVYVPTTPNPTSGYFIIVPRSRVRDLDMTVDEALKYVISMGVVAPRGSGVRRRAAPRAVPCPRARRYGTSRPKLTGSRRAPFAVALARPAGRGAGGPPPRIPPAIQDKRTGDLP